MSRVERRLRWYWPMEAANVVIVPLAAVGVSLYFEGGISPSMLVAAAAASALLVIGTIYLRAAHRQSRRDASALAFWLPFLAAMQIPAALIVAGACAFTGYEIAVAADPWAVERLVALVLCVLALLEYVNYYHIQLQHFDNAADFQRLLSGKGFRPSPLARDLARWKSQRSDP